MQTKNTTYVQQRKIYIALFHRIIDIVHKLCVQFARIRKKVCLCDRVCRYLASNSVADEAVDLFRTVLKRSILIWIRSMDQVDVNLYGGRLRFVVWT